MPCYSWLLGCRRTLVCNLDGRHGDEYVVAQAEPRIDVDAVRHFADDHWSSYFLG